MDLLIGMALAGHAGRPLAQWIAAQPIRTKPDPEVIQTLAVIDGKDEFSPVQYLRKAVAEGTWVSLLF